MAKLANDITDTAFMSHKYIYWTYNHAKTNLGGARMLNDDNKRILSVIKDVAIS